MVVFLVFIRVPKKEQFFRQIVSFEDFNSYLCFRTVTAVAESP